MFAQIILTALIVVSYCNLQCAHSKKKDEPPQLTSLCVFNSEEKVCWLNKEDHQGYLPDEMNGFYCMSKEDMSDLYFKIITKDK